MDNNLRGNGSGNWKHKNWIKGQKYKPYKARRRITQHTARLVRICNVTELAFKYKKFKHAIKVELIDKNFTWLCNFKDNS